MSFLQTRPTGGQNKACICKQVIRVVYGYNGARNKIQNMEDGVGGLKGDDHICPDKLKSGSYADLARMKKKFLCHRCAKFYQGVYIECPNCFKLQCQACSYLYDWRLEYPDNAPKPLKEGGNCPRCGSLYNELLTITRINPDNPTPKRRKFVVVAPFKSSNDPDIKVEIELDVYDMITVKPFDSHAENIILREFKHGNRLKELVTTSS